MVQDAKATITIRVVGAPEPVPWWLLGVAGGLTAVTVVFLRSGKKKKRKR